MVARKKKHYTAAIGDMVHSRDLSPKARAKAQQEFSKLVERLNKRFAAAVASNFVITLGDEFQGLLSDATVIPDLIWAVETEYRRRDVRLGFGFGTLHTPMQSRALNIDGPVLHNARAAIETARSKRILGGIFVGFGKYDDVLTGFAEIQRHVRHRMTPRQREIVELLREGGTQVDAAATFDITKQAVSRHVAAAGWDAYRAAEQGWRTTLDLATMDVKK